MDSALGCAVFSVIKPGEAYTTIEFKLNLVRPVLPGMGEVFCEGRIVHRGRTIAFVASMPPRVCMNEILISPTHNRGFIQTPANRD